MTANNAPCSTTVIPGCRASARPGLSRFRVWLGACHRAALCADPLEPPREDGVDGPQRHPCARLVVVIRPDKGTVHDED
jgi:hypothetical protein